MKWFKNPGVLGINARNLLYIRPYNKKKSIHFADDKLKSKQFFSARGIPVPKLYSVIRNQDDLGRFDFASLPSSFVLKPNMGFGGQGIIPVLSHKGDQFEKPNGELVSLAKMSEQVSDILDGRFSISGTEDTAFFEQRIICDPRIAKFADKGLPDIRVVVHNLIPVMAMLRLPTKESDGKANLHQGAIGVGIDIARGTATHILYKGKVVQDLPNLGNIRGLTIPYWDEILLIASKIQLLSNLGYLAADIALDKNQGPMLLEINARAGLQVQIANLALLRRRLERIQGLKVKTPEKGVRIAQEMFGNKLDKEIKKATGKVVVSTREKVAFLVKEGETSFHWAFLNTNQEHSQIDNDLVKKLQLAPKEESSTYKVKLSVSGSRLQTVLESTDLSDKNYELILGRKDLRNFLIDPSKGNSGVKKTLETAVNTPKLIVRSNEYKNFRILDQEIVSIDSQIQVLYHLKPLNFLEEELNFIENKKKSPHFIYPELNFDPIYLSEQIDKLRKDCDESPLGQLFEKKLQELSLKIELLLSIGTSRLEACSHAIYGALDEKILNKAKERLKTLSHLEYEEESLLSSDEIFHIIQDFLKKKGLSHWHVEQKKEMVSVASVNKSRSLFLREGFTCTRTRLKMLMAHEIETHLYSSENGEQQYYQSFQKGFGFYLKTQEGLAIYNQREADEMTRQHPKNKRAPLLVILSDFAKNNSFLKCFEFFSEAYDMPPSRAFRTTLKLKRGMEDSSQSGVFTKELVYFKGLLEIESFIQSGGEIKDLYYGKYALEDLNLIKEVPNLKEPNFLPSKGLDLHAS